jgi:hypothetical protein
MQVVDTLRQARRLHLLLEVRERRREDIIALQRHFRVLTKFAHVALRLSGHKRQRGAVFYAPVNLCDRRPCSASVAVGIVVVVNRDRVLWSDRLHELHALLTVHRDQDAEHTCAAEMEESEVDLGIATGNLLQIVDNEGIPSNVQTEERRCRGRLKLQETPHDVG